MELNRENFCAIIFYNFRRGLTQFAIFGNEALSRTSVYRWNGEFNRVCSSLQDEFPEGLLQNQFLFRKPLKPLYVLRTF